MDIKKATSVQMVTPKYGLAIFETNWEDKPCKPTVHFIIKNTRKDGSIWYQMTPGWYIEDLISKSYHVDIFDMETPGIYIDYGANWFIPAGPYGVLQMWMEDYMEGGRWTSEFLVKELDHD